MKPIKQYIKQPRNIGLALVRHLTWLPDEPYIRLRFRFEMGSPLNLKNPQTFQEKLQWLKLYHRKPEFTSMVDKLAVKDYVARRIGSQYVIPTLGVWDTPDQIDFDALPDRFVLKATHGGGSGGVIICRDKSALNIDEVRRRLANELQVDLYRTYREWPYKDVPRKIIAEKLIETPDGQDLKDYKFFCFDGQVRFFKVDFDRFTGHRANYFAPDWTLLPFGEAQLPPVPEKHLPRPDNFDLMIRLAEQLSAGHPFLRVDLYNNGGRIYFGELTFYPASGLGPFTSAQWDLRVGQMLHLPETEPLTQSVGGGNLLIFHELERPLPLASLSNSQECRFSA